MRFAACLILLTAWPIVAQDLSGAPDGATLPMIVEIPTPPIAVLADGRYRLAYELHLTNWSSHEMFLTSIQVAPSAQAGSGFEFAGQDLAQSIISSDSKEKNKLRITPGSRARRRLERPERARFESASQTRGSPPMPAGWSCRKDGRSIFYK